MQDRRTNDGAEYEVNETVTIMQPYHVKCLGCIHDTVHSNGCLLSRIQSRCRYILGLSGQNHSIVSLRVSYIHM